MECPKCKRPVLVGAKNCVYCGQDLSAIQSLHWLKDDLKQAKQSAQVLTGSLQDIDRRLSELEKGFLNWVAASTATAPPGPLDVPQKGESASPEPAVSAHALNLTEAVFREGGAKAAPLAARLGVGRGFGPAPHAHEAETSDGSSSGEAEVRFGQKWMLIAGLAVTVLGIAYFLKYSFDRNWITPAGRVALAYLCGLGCLAAGEVFRRKQFAMFGLYVFGAGIATLYAATFAAFQVYQLLHQAVAFALMVAVTGLAGGAALWFDTMWLAVLGLVGGFATPVVLSSGTADQVALMTYMVILNLGVLSIALLKRWKVLNQLGFVFTWLLFTVWMIRYYEPEHFWPTLIYLNLFYLTYALAPFAPYFWGQAAAKTSEFVFSAPNSIIALAYSIGLIQEHFSRRAVSVATLAYSALFGALAFLMYKRFPANRKPLALLIAKAGFFLVVSVPLLFTGHWITICWAVQAVALAWAATRLADRRLFASSILLLCLALWKQYFFDYPEVYRLELDPVRYADGYHTQAVPRFVSEVVMLLSVLSYSRFLAALGAGLGKFAQDLGTATAALFGVLLFGTLTVEVGAFCHDHAPSSAPAAISVTWALYSLALMGVGFALNLHAARITSMWLFGLTSLKVLLIDMADASTPHRIISLIVLGLLMVGSSFLYHRFARRIQGASVPNPDALEDGPLDLSRD
ncbi:MAG: DUF2339 domain-containing protein [Candidatus Omnitrophica bacterium]|nr:DUF2339 domain-containing protein [Candidatus Omnitrophota bacterium]